jgi:hypothetical protein
MPKAISVVSQFDNLPIGEIVDQLGTVKAEIADLEAREKTLRAELLKRCVFEAEGAVYAATVTQAMRWTLDAKAVRAELGDNWWNARCKQALVTTVTVAARAVSIQRRQVPDAPHCSGAVLPQPQNPGTGGIDRGVLFGLPRERGA